MNIGRILADVNRQQEDVGNLLIVLHEELEDLVTMEDTPSAIGTLFIDRKELLFSLLGAAQEILRKQARITDALSRTVIAAGAKGGAAHD
ncbi:hypothetical protein DWV16_08825 [Anaerotruncus sp. AF02-27]|uniref:hypothetical protein n=1 Tax=Anaerotruncus sp. AF02-27 TaxID=2292191 RepID=UPI000E5536B8|nr:hypothetical protein [Anaerotruncus sp. AF02-27]RGX55315.1 hypothetical protein DWV16_08825 [Anaerotruncus sp. AF02-27]